MFKKISNNTGPKSMINKNSVTYKNSCIILLKILLNATFEK